MACGVAGFLGEGTFPEDCFGRYGANAQIDARLAQYDVILTCPNGLRSDMDDSGNLVDQDFPTLRAIHPDIKILTGPALLLLR
jgi:hypothetical protein